MCEGVLERACRPPAPLRVLRRRQAAPILAMDARGLLTLAGPPHATCQRDETCPLVRRDGRDLSTLYGKGGGGFWDASVRGLVCTGAAPAPGKGLRSGSWCWGVSDETRAVISAYKVRFTRPGTHARPRPARRPARDTSALHASPGEMHSSTSRRALYSNSSKNPQTRASRSEGVSDVHQMHPMDPVTPTPPTMPPVPGRAAPAPCGRLLLGLLAFQQSLGRASKHRDLLQRSLS